MVAPGGLDSFSCLFVQGRSSQALDDTLDSLFN